MPRQDVFDNRALRNLKGIDLRKNADSNSAEDMVNVWINPQNLFTNRPMPSLYQVGETIYNTAYKFACECKNLAGSEVEIDITSAETKPTVTGKQEATDESGEIWILGTNLETVRTILWIDSDNGGVLVSGVDFSFYYDRENNRLAIVLKEDMDYSSYDHFTLITPYGAVTTMYLGLVADYYIGQYGEYKIRTYLSGSSPMLSFDAKQSNGSYKQMQVYGNPDVKLTGKEKHYSVKGVRDIWFNNHYGHIGLDTTDHDNPVLRVQYYGGELTDAFTVEGGHSVGTAQTVQEINLGADSFLIGQDDAFQLVAESNSLAIQIKDGSNYTNLVSF